MDKKENRIKIFTDFSMVDLHCDIILEKYFYTTFKQLEKKFGCVYLSYVIEGGTYGEKIQFSTDKEWNILYFKKGLSEHCHIGKICREMKQKNCSFTIDWNLIPPDDNKSRKVHLLRRELNFDNGVTYATLLYNKSFGTYYELINIIGNNLDIHFYKEMRQNKKQVSLILKNLRERACSTLTKRLNMHFLYTKSLLYRRGGFGQRTYH